MQTGNIGKDAYIDGGYLRKTFYTIALAWGYNYVKHDGVAQGVEWQSKSFQMLELALRTT